MDETEVTKISSDDPVDGGEQVVAADGGEQVIEAADGGEQVVAADDPVDGGEQLDTAKVPEERKWECTCTNGVDEPDCNCEKTSSD